MENAFRQSLYMDTFKGCNLKEPKGGRKMAQADEKKTVLFICTHNSARSQMAEGLLRAVYNDRYEAHSAGAEPSTVSPYAVKVMKEIGIDIAKQNSKSVEQFRGMSFEFVVTVCDGTREACSFFPVGKNYLHKGFEDPSRFSTDMETLAAFRRVRDEIKDWIVKTFGQN